MDRRHIAICGLSPLYSMFHLVKGATVGKKKNVTEPKIVFGFSLQLSSQTFSF